MHIICPELVFSRLSMYKDHYGFQESITTAILEWSAGYSNSLANHVWEARCQGLSYLEGHRVQDTAALHI